METIPSLEEQIKKEKECLDFINLWFKGTFFLTGIIWVISITLLTKLNIDLLITPSILFTGGTVLTSVYMLIQRKKFKNNIKKLNHKLYIKETSELLSKKTNNKTNIENYSNTKNNTYTYKPNNNYNNIQLSNQPLKNYKIQRRVLKRNRISKHKKSD